MIFRALPVFGTVSQVCVYGKDIEFDAPSNSYAYAYLPNGDAEFSDSCVLHLDGPWWEASQGVVGDEWSCPGGFSYIGPSRRLLVSQQRSGATARHRAEP
ncbi:MAG: hypothetical protein ABSD78_19195 [Acidimicrobiales bacterium]